MQNSNCTENMLGRGIHHCPQQQPALGESPRSLRERALARKDKNSQLKTFWEIQWTDQEKVFNLTAHLCSNCRDDIHIKILENRI